ncbi:MAG: hypothetical protein V8S96_07445 [Lachnospiraceae bacterium]
MSLMENSTALWASEREDYKLGQKIRVRVIAVDRVGSTIDFMPEEDS